jgi:predicted nuclease of predicted toxin-antitoxin system
MPIMLYMDHHIPKAITVGLRLRDVDVITAYEDGTDKLDDDQLLQRAHELNRALFTQDDDLLEEARNVSEKEFLFRG